MDFEMIDVKTEGSTLPTWDFKVKNGMLMTLDHNNAVEQRSNIAVFLQRGTIPQMESTGNQWAELMTNQVSPQSLNNQVRQSIVDMTGQLAFMPKYSEVDGKLVVEVKKV